MAITLGVAMAAGAAISGLVQAYNSSQASASAKAELKEVINALNGIKDPKFDYSTLTPQQFQLVAKYVPKIAPYVEEKAPQVVSRSAAGNEALDARRAALRKFQDIAAGRDVESDVAMTEASNRAAQQNQIQSASLSQDMARRGIAPGGGMEFARQLIGQADTGNQLAQADRMAAVEGRKRALEAMRSSADIAAGIDTTELGLQSKNVDIWNDFNARTTRAQQQYQNNVADTENEAQRYNVGNAQRISEMNTGLANTSAVSERARRDGLVQQEYDNAIKKVGVQRGVAVDSGNATLTAAKDQNAAIQGVTNAGIAAGMYYGTKSAPYDDLDLENYGAKRVAR